MTVYYLVYGDVESGLSIGNFRSHNEQLIDALAKGATFRIREIPNENSKPNPTAKILEIFEVSPEPYASVNDEQKSIYVEAQRQHAEMMNPVHIVQNTQATADVKAARVLEEFENGVLPSVQRVKLKAETHPTDRAIAEWIVGEKTKHASIVSRAYDTGEAGSLEKYTEEVQSIVRMTLEAIKPEPSTQASCAIPGVSQKTRYKCVICDHEELRHHDGSAPIRQVCSICGVSSLFQITDDVWR